MPKASEVRWALVAGGSGGIGRAIAKALAEDGWNLAITYRSNHDGAAETAVRVERAGASARLLQIDLRDTEDCAAMVSGLAAEVRLAGLVYAAGPRIPYRYLSEVDAAELRGVLEGDVLACFNLVRPAIPALREHRGSFVALTTQAVARHAKRDSLSSVPKSAVEGIVKAIAVEEGRYGISANAIGVGMIEGEGMWESNWDSGNYDRRTLDAAMGSIPLGRFGSPEDVAGLARFLLSPEGAWISGQTINVDGAYSA